MNDDVRAVFIMVLATVLRCYPLRPEFIANKGVERVLGVLDEKSDVIVEAVSYLIGYRVDTCPLMCSLLGQDKQYRHFILTKRYSFIETLCSLDPAPLPRCSSRSRASSSKTRRRPWSLRTPSTFSRT